MTSEIWLILCRNCNSRLHKLLGVNDAELTPRLLSTYNINTLQVSFASTLFLNLRELFLDDFFLQVIVNDFRERIEQYNGELVQVKIHLIKVFFLTEWRCKGELLMDQYVLGCKRNSRTMLMLQMLIEKDELQQEQEGVIFVFFIKIHSQTFHFLPFFCFDSLEWAVPQVLMDIEDLGCEEWSTFPSC